MNHRWAQLLTWLPASFAAVMPLHPRASTWLMLLWLPVWLAAFLRKQLTWRPLTGTSVAMMALYAWFVAGGFWSEDTESAWFALEVKASLVLLPLVFQTLPEPAPNQSWKRWLFVGLTLAVLVRAGAASVGWPGAGWRYADWTGPFHPTYLAMYWSWGICLARGDRAKWLIPLFSVAIGLAASKAGWLGAGFALISLLPVGRRHWLPVLIGALGLVVAGAVADQGRLGEFVAHAPGTAGGQEEAGQSVAKTTGSTGGRLQAWHVAAAVFAEHPIVGVGTGDYAQAVEPIYLDQGLAYAAAHHMNAHNAFLQMAVMLGAVGLLLLLFWWGTSMWAAWRLADWGLVCSMLLVLFHGLFESVLELQQGIVAVVFLSSMAGGVLNSPASRTS